MKNYRKLEVFAGSDIESAVEELRNHSDLVCIEFNGKMLYSDVDNLDSAYKKITGKTKAEFDAMLKVDNDRYKEEKQKHEEAIPELTKEWIEKGNQILDEKYRATWARCVPIRLGDLYRGMELKCCLDIVEKLNADCTLDEAKAIIESQGHSGMSFSLVCSMIKSFCDRGNEFVNFVR